MSYTLKGLKERLKWITQSEKQAIWLKIYLKNRGWFDNSIYGDIFDTHGKEFLDLIRYEWGLLDNTANERERISKARSAWNSYSKETKNQTYSLSPDVTKRINYLAKKHDITRSRVIEELVKQTDDIDRLEGKIRKLLKVIEVKDDDGYSIKYLTQSINDVFNVNELKEELEAATEMLRNKEFEQDSPLELTDEKEYLRNELKELNIKLKKSKEDCAIYQEVAEKAKAELNEYLSS
ncbi:hypothetical protein [Vibrio scophthalmi]|uniref:Uncharacterized protein n=1 Tax=Vibrio scophthalmi TaxID=45658 RepID=A0A1C7F697_9VIBR|nr:hypothetical protein [Vibrio scophthalmi]ANU35655.1 hypothetical protein VSVS05_00522 [Vibrio scophthalmi]